MTGLRSDDRANLSFHIIVFFASLVIAAVLYILLEPMAMTILDLAESQTETSAAADGQQYLRWTFESMHILVIGLGVLQLLAASVYESRVST